jgi:hypothetical protein
MTSCNLRLSPDARKRAEFFAALAEVQRSAEVMLAARRCELGLRLRLCDPDKEHPNAQA